MSVLKPAARLELIAVLVFFALLGFLTYPDSGSGAASSTIDFDSSVTLLNDLPNVSSLYLNSGNPIILTPATTTDIYVTFNIQDDNGCGDVFFNGTTSVKVFRSGVGSSCSPDGRNCYLGTITSHACPSATSTTMGANATATVAIQFYADATDASSTNSGDTWQAYVSATDEDAGTHSTTTNPGVELNTLLAIELDKSSIDYGQLELGQSTGSSNQSTTIDNVGNSKMNIKVHGTAMTSGGDSVATSSQHYASSGFTYGGGEQLLSDVATLIAGVTSFASGTSNSTSSVGSWTKNATNYPNALYYHTIEAYDGCLFTVGGTLNGMDATTTTRFVQINTSTHAVGSWTATQSLPVGLFNHSSVVNGNKIYIAGGETGVGARTSTIMYASLNSAGGISPWTNTISLPIASRNGNLITHNNKFYMLGTGYPATTTVLFSDINGLGVLGGWSSTTPLPYTVYDSGLAIYNNYLYIIGGFANGAANTTTVLYASIAGDGQLGSWQYGTPLPYNMTGPFAAVKNEYVYLTPKVDKDVYMAKLSPGGGIESGWSTTTIRSQAAYSNPKVVQQYDYLYLVAGGGASTSSIFYAPINYTAGAPPDTTIYWGASVPSDADTGNYTSSITYTAVWSP